MLIYILSAIGILFLFLIINGIRRNKWFMNLKPGDEILVKIFSEDCDCYKKAIVVKSPSKKISTDKYNNPYCEDSSSYREVSTYLVEVKFDQETINKCKKCAEEHDNNCWYNVTKFSRYDVKPYKCSIKGKISNT